MSAVKEEVPTQDAPKAQTIVGDQHLATLQSMLNLLFLQSGRFIKEQQSGGGTGRQKLALQRAVPVAAERFHDALDELEKEVRLRQVVVRRDLALLYQDRRKREVEARQKEAEKARLAAESRSVGNVETKVEEVKIEKVSTPAQPEALTETEPEKNDEPEMSLKREEEKVLPPPIETTNEPTEERDPLFDGTPTTANLQNDDFDFDAMFGDAMETTGDNSNQDNMMDTSGDMDFNFDEDPSLLRGLEDFAKSGEDENAAQNASTIDINMTMADLPDLHTTTNAPVEQLAEQLATTKVEESQTTQPPADTTTNNDASNNDSANNNAANDDGMGGMVTETANLDDLFDLDEYANPEDSAFDDAFFNFE
ncbi:hypothetical protein EK21DRAFT_101282 [Setomelanomma holmii]|uniref:Uncharacterized protein n=1 Tax=Setomelanomma holmii TaxID=210430 RepID=A0A9P4H6T7_9PLEO|nr:hypothetical protein EK21DRAFT_101282 [Setomelanomma holmii]